MSPFGGGGGGGDSSADSTVLQDCAVSNQAIQDSAVDSSKLADSAVSTLGLQDSAVTLGKLADSSVDSSKLTDCAVNTQSIQDSAITGAKIADSSIDSSEIADCAVTNQGLGDSAVDSTKLSDSSVSTLGLQDCAVTYAKIQDVTAQRILGREDAVAGSPQEISLSAELRFDTNNDWLEITDSGITNGLIADSAIDSSKLTDCAVPYRGIQNITAARLIGRYDATAAGVIQEIALGANLTFDSDAGTLIASGAALADCGVLTQHIKDSAVTTVKILDSAVDSSKLADSAVSSAGIQDGTIVVADLADSAVDSSKLSDSAVSSAGIQDGTIVSADMADSAVDSSKLSDSAVSSAGIQDGTILAADFYDTRIVTRIIEVHATDTTLSVGDTVATFFIPAELDSFDLVRAEAAVKVISTTGRPTFQIRDVTGAADMMSVKITIDSGEKTSYTSDTASVVDTNNDTLLTGQEIAIDIDSAGTGTEDLYLILSARKP